MNLHPVTCALLLSLALLPAAPVELAFTPVKGESLGVSYEMVYETELTSMERVSIIDDEENEQEVQEISITRKTVEHVQFTDEFLEVEDGRPLRVRRALEELTMVQTEEATDAEGETTENVDEGESELAGTTVLFQWDEDEEEYTRSFAEEEDELDEDLLEELKLTGHLSECLSDEELEVGDTWLLDVEVFNAMVAPGGDHQVVMESDPEGEQREANEEYRQQFDENLDGDVIAEFQGTREEDGVQVAVIGLVVELTSEVELEQEINVNFEINGEKEEGEGSIVRSYEIYYDLTGEILWDLEAGHAISFELSGDTETKFVESFRAENDAFSLENRTTSSFEGTVTHRIEYD